MNITDDEFPALSGLLGNYFHQDMDLEFDSDAEAIAEYANVTAEPRKRQLLGEMAAFMERYHNDLEGELSRRYQLDVGPHPTGQTVPEFFEMIRAIIADPKSYVRFHPHP
ncbi:hypothetical protein DSM25558_4439 [Agrobacterium sp. DSM 25558]|uniref:contact-dependent growth inhibition system immunity protein n=1 Tax=Agrobacterium sp. DSM 25558 TaxID=1907665 RepID=UPI00097241B3|nr:contact-dependent growth inhibition system immunity protein [Agrobacterium sp. DSM 25558]SCX28324.1 hypothetical protein DSM25558_4439 [Agrobacterium sp. DSM 25558]